MEYMQSKVAASGNLPDAVSASSPGMTTARTQALAAKPHRPPGDTGAPAAQASGPLDQIVVVGASEHNLQNVDITLPRDTLTVFTGVSGSGKSSLAFDTLFKEGQRRFLESLSPYARQFLGQMEKPKVEHVEGLSPTVSIDQKTVNRNPRSTVGTITELYDHYRLLFARFGQPYCPKCQVPIASLTAEQIADRIYTEYGTLQVEAGSVTRASPRKGAGKQGSNAITAAAAGPVNEGPAVIVYAPMVRERKGEYREELKTWREQGYVRARVDGEIKRLEDEIVLKRYEKHTLELVLDRFKLEPGNRPRLIEALEKALELAKGLVILDIGEESVTYSSSRTCPKCGKFTVPELEPRLFSFNDPQGACATCHGLGTLSQFTEEKLTRPELSLADGTLACFTEKGNLVFTDIDRDYLHDLARHLGVPWDKPWGELPQKARDLLLYGNVEEELRPRIVFRNPWVLIERLRRDKQWPGLVAVLKTVARFVGSALDRYQEVSPCSACKGRRLNPVALAVRFRTQTIDTLSRDTVEDSVKFFATLELTPTEQLIGKDIFREIRARLGFLNDVGVGYLSLDRKATTLSGGEAQRIRLASQVGSGLQGVLYILDEPSIGLHQSDNRKLIQTLQRLRDAGNSVVVVEHDQETIEAADHVVDIGPGAGTQGGRILAQGSLKDLVACDESLSGQYLAGRMAIPIPEHRRSPNGKAITVQGAKRHNLDNLTVSIPLGLFVAVTGVSGSGKSTLVHDILKRALTSYLANEPLGQREYKKLTGLEHLDKVIEIDQSPIGRTPRSNPATYTKVFDQIRALFAEMPEAKLRGYAPGRFSFNVKGGRCEACEGAGVRTIEMQFLSDVEVECEECRGKRFNDETLQILYKGKNIHQVLDLTVEEGVAFFANIPGIAHILKTLNDVGLGYIRIGQPSTTLSGGEAQRVKLASELRKRGTGRTLYLLDEPTTGLHFHDIRTLLQCLNALVDAGNTVLVIEHNLDVVKVADWVIDLGPGGGRHGGQLVGEGTPEQVAKLPGSLTGQVLKPVLRPHAAASTSTGSKRKLLSHDLRVRGAEKNNLKHLDVTVPRNSFTVITGVSGSGKTSLAFDTIFAEGQARYVESLSTYARRFLGRMDKARVDGIDGLAPAIAIDQQNASRSPRSTIATTTEIYDYLRLLYARVGEPHCPRCNVKLEGWSPTRLARDLAETRPGERMVILAPLFRPDSGHPQHLDTPQHLAQAAPTLVAEGFVRVLISGEMVELQEWLALPEKQRKVPATATVDLVMDRVRIAVDQRTRLAEALEAAYKRGHGLARLSFPDAEGPLRERLASEAPGCVEHDTYLLEPLTPRMFSFNSHVGACPACDGLGHSPQVNPELLIAAPEHPLLDGALVEGPVGNALSRKGGKFARTLKAFAKREGIPLTKPFGKLTAKQQRLLLRGDGRELAFANRGWGYRWTQTTTFEGIAGLVLELYQSSEREKWAPHVEPVLEDVPCRVCEGERLKPEVRAVKLGGLNISQFCAYTVERAASVVDEWHLNRSQRQIAEQPLQEVKSRLGFLKDVGLGYLTLAREAMTLSGGEAQRIRLASQLGSRLVGVLYVLDEPTIGLHPRDTGRLLETLKRLRDPGNTVIVVEHDSETIRAADHIIDIGPGAGHRGGEVVAAGRPDEIARHPTSLTGAYLSGRLGIRGPEKPRKVDLTRSLTVKGARANNLKSVSTSFPLGAFTAVTGVSGSGKSTLVVEVLQKVLLRQLNGARVVPGAHDALTGLELADKLVDIDQSPIGRSPKSNPATYTGAWDPIRNLMAQMPDAKQRGWGPGRFSFNVKGGRCEACEGRGYNHIEMHFLADVWVPCDVCEGKRYNRETLQVKFRGKSIADILDSEITDVLELFANQPQIKRRLQTLADVGLGYMKLGQSGTTLSGGEAQRVKLAAELGRPGTGRTVYILDEPTTGLHLDDVAKLMTVLHRLVDEGNTVIVIEHNLDVIRTADWVIDLGPEGGDAGGEIVATGTPTEIARHPRSHTGAALRGGQQA
jgi:excinuclease ABC subunit A